MQVMVNTFGEGAKIPGVDIGMSVILFELYISPDQYAGYTGASNEPALGNFSFKTEWVDIPGISAEKQEKWNNLHGQIVFVKMRPSHFLYDGGIVEFELSRKDFSTGSETVDTLSFVAQNCTGWSILAGEVSFKCELLQLENA